MAHGLLVYTVLLKHVEKEYPGSLICSLAKYYSGLLINLCKEKVSENDTKWNYSSQFPQQTYQVTL